MDFKFFKDSFFSNLIECNKKCFSDISNNEKIISECLQDRDSKDFVLFINEFIDVVLNTTKKRDFDFYEKILSIKLLTRVLEGIRDSNILIRACERKDIKLIKWLLTMDINCCVQDEDGMTALMAASAEPDLLFVVKELSRETDSINIRDKNGRTALFYSVDNIEALRVLLDSCGCNPNILDKNNDSVLTYCCRKRKYDAVKTLSSKNTVDVNVFNDEERTAAMYLIEDGRFSELRYLINDTINFHYMNDKKESAMTILFKRFYEYYKELDMKSLIPYIKIVKVLVDKNVNLDISIDDEGNTPMMFFSMIEDWDTLAYIINFSHKFNLSLQNKKGESVGSILMKQKPTKASYYSSMNIKSLLKYLFSDPSFDPSCCDNVGNNVIMNYIISSTVDIDVMGALNWKKEFFSHVNQHGENLLIIAVKFRRHDIIRKIIKSEGCQINQQDEMGNTALHYAVMMNDYRMVNCLTYNHADINIKNKEGKSPMNLVNESGDSTMKKFILKPCNSHDFKKIEERSQSSSIFSFGEKHKFGPLNENLRMKYQESRQEEIHYSKEEFKYQPNKTAKHNTEYYKEAFTIYFPYDINGYRRGEVQLDRKLRDLLNLEVNEWCSVGRSLWDDELLLF